MPKMPEPLPSEKIIFSLQKLFLEKLLVNNEEKILGFLKENIPKNLDPNLVFPSNNTFLDNSSLSRNLIRHRCPLSLIFLLPFLENINMQEGINGHLISSLMEAFISEDENMIKALYSFGENLSENEKKTIKSWQPPSKERAEQMQQELAERTLKLSSFKLELT